MDPLLVIAEIAVAVLLGIVIATALISILDRWALKRFDWYRPYPRPIWRFVLPSTWWWRRKWRP